MTIRSLPPSAAPPQLVTQKKTLSGSSSAKASFSVQNPSSKESDETLDSSQLFQTGAEHVVFQLVQQQSDFKEGEQNGTGFESETPTLAATSAASSGEAEAFSSEGSNHLEKMLARPLHIHQVTTGNGGRWRSIRFNGLTYQTQQQSQAIIASPTERDSDVQIVSGGNSALLALALPTVNSTEQTEPEQESKQSSVAPPETSSSQDQQTGFGLLNLDIDGSERLRNMTRNQPTTPSETDLSLLKKRNPYEKVARPVFHNPQNVKQAALDLAMGIFSKKAE